MTESALESGPPATVIIRVRRRLSTLCLLAGWLCANGVVWNVVQVVGWVKMLHDYSQVMPAGEAWRMTFDGSAPCRFCRLSQQAEDTAKRELPADAALGGGTEKLLLIADLAAEVLVPAPAVRWPGPADEAGRFRADDVPVPPPRA